MFVRVQLEFSSKENAVVVPRNAIVKRERRQGVFVIDTADATAHFVPVELGIASGNRVEITSPELDRPVATLGNHLLTDGVPVIVPKQFRPAAPEADKAAESEPAAAEAPERK